MVGDHDVVVVTVSDAQPVCGHAVPSAGLDKPLHGRVVLQSGDNDQPGYYFCCYAEDQSALKVPTSHNRIRGGLERITAPLRTHNSFRWAFGPEPLIQSIVSEGSRRSPNAPLDCSNGDCLPHDFNQT